MDQLGWTILYLLIGVGAAYIAYRMDVSTVKSKKPVTYRMDEPSLAWLGIVLFLWPAFGFVWGMRDLNDRYHEHVHNVAANERAAQSDEENSI